MKVLKRRRMATKKVAGKAAKVGKASEGLSVAVYSPEGAKSGSITLPELIFGQKANPSLLAQTVRVFLTNQRTAGSKTKRRSDVSLTTAKMYRQKGTGRARHGSYAAPIFVGGGVAHGPNGLRPRLDLPMKMKQKALAQALSEKVRTDSFVVADIEKIEPKTKKVATLLSRIGLEKGATIVHGGSRDIFQAARNIEGVTLVPAVQLTAYNVLVGRKVLLTKEAIKVLETRFKIAESK